MFKGRSNSKYGNVRCKLGDRSFMSGGERACAMYLQALEQAGEIRDLEYQVTVRLGPNQRRWILDFRYFDEKRGCQVYADYKGYEPDRWRHLLDLWALEGPAPLLVYKGSGMRMKVTEEVVARSSADERR